MELLDIQVKRCKLFVIEDYKEMITERKYDILQERLNLFYITFIVNIKSMYYMTCYLCYHYLFFTLLETKIVDLGNYQI